MSDFQLLNELQKAGNDALFCACLKSIFIVGREERQMVLHMVRTRPITVMLTLNNNNKNRTINLASKILQTFLVFPFVFSEKVTLNEFSACKVCMQTKDVICSVL